MTPSIPQNITTLKEPWVLYILECRDNSLYTGITNRLSVRLENHQAGLGARYTRSRLPVKLVYTEICSDRSDASKREWVVKKLPRSKKLELIKAGVIHQLNLNE
jgi:putative endonuclease